VSMSCVYVSSSLQSSDTVSPRFGCSFVKHKPEALILVCQCPVHEGR